MARKNVGEKAERASGSVRRKTRWGTQQVRTQTQWCDEIETRFLECLAATSNVGLACEQSGVGPTSAYRQRRKRADFAIKWQEALEQGYARLEAALLRAAADTMEGVIYDADVIIPPISPETALSLLKVHRASVTGVGKVSGWKMRVLPIDEVKASILKRIEAIERAGEDEVPEVYRDKPDANDCADEE